MRKPDSGRGIRSQLTSRDRFNARKPIPEHSHRSSIVRIGREPEKRFQTLARHDACDVLSAPLEDEAEGLFISRDLRFGHKHFHERYCDFEMRRKGRGVPTRGVLHRFGSPVYPVLCFDFFMASVVIDVKVDAGGGQRCVSELVANHA
jgi:hypothetical protein